VARASRELGMPKMTVWKMLLAFAEHLANVFQPHPSENKPKEEEELIRLLETPYQLEPPINILKTAQDQEVINSLNPKKSSGYGLLIGEILKNCLLLQ
jgi:hypothetical protein